MVNQSQFNPYLLHSSFNLTWIGTSQNLHIPTMNGMHQVSPFLLGVSFFSSIVEIINSSRISPMVRNTSGASFASHNASACFGYSSSIQSFSDSAVLVVNNASLFITPNGIAVKHASVCALPLLRYLSCWFFFKWTQKNSSPSFDQYSSMSKYGNASSLHTETILCTVPCKSRVCRLTHFTVLLCVFFMSCALVCEVLRAAVAFVLDSKFRESINLASQKVFLLACYYQQRGKRPVNIT